MPDHVHLIINPINCDISKVMNSLKSASARKIVDWLKEFNHESSLRKLALATPAKTRSQPRRLAKGFFCHRFVESEVHSTKVELRSSEPGQSRFVQTSGG